MPYTICFKCHGSILCRPGIQIALLREHFVYGSILWHLQGFGLDRIRTLISMAKDSSHRVIMEEML